MKYSDSKGPENSSYNRNRRYKSSGAAGITKIWGGPHHYKKRIHPHFSFNTLAAAVLIVFLGAALIVQTFMGYPLTPSDAGALTAAVIVAAAVMALFPLWPVVLVLILFIWIVVMLSVEVFPLAAAALAAVYNGANGAAPEGEAVKTISQVLASRLTPALSLVSLGVLFAPCFQIVQQWHKVVVLRLGKYKRVMGAGPHLLMPVVDTVVRTVDMRIRVTDFSAEKSITKDTVPVHVDALAFWMVWDAQKASLEVQDYLAAVTLSAQTALRDSIGKNDLATLLSERERLGSEIQTSLDAKTSPWGITILSIEFKEILIPKELEDALSKKAQAEREKQSRVILGSAEVEISSRFAEAAKEYENNPTAFQLRAMNMVYDSVRTNKNMVIVPSSALDSMGLGTTLGAAALQKLQENQQQPYTQADTQQQPPHEQAEVRQAPPHEQAE